MMAAPRKRGPVGKAKARANARAYALPKNTDIVFQDDRLPPTPIPVKQELFIRSLSPSIWCRYGAGITVVTGVSQWSDQSGNGRHLLQAAGASQPALQADGSILFDGVDDFLGATLSLVQPFTVFILYRMVAFSAAAQIVGMRTGGTCTLRCSTLSPQVEIAATAGATIIAAGSVPVGTYNVASAVFSGANSLVAVNAFETASATGTSLMNLFNVGSGNAGTAPSNIQVKEVVAFPSALSGQNRAAVRAYLNRIGGLRS